MSPRNGVVRLRDYRPPAWLVDDVHLDFDLHPNDTLVAARLRVRRNPEAAATEDGDLPPLRLDGEGLELIDIRADNSPLVVDEDFSLDDGGLTLPRPPAARFELFTQVRIDPAANTQLSGLYMSAGAYCTQCEAEGFRRITFWPDRPDVLARFTVRIVADAHFAPVLLSNGDMTEQGGLAGGRHYAVWTDPHPKPSYLFALVAGRFDCLEDGFTTMDGRDVRLRIWVAPGRRERARWAMACLKRAMGWDETRFGLAYDLDEYNIVAVPDFNMGAMENKSLNIFNDRYILADTAIATDADHEHIEGIVAHEYFHNWTGNRITLRDWFQLCLKEGLTVFRDQEFTADVRSRAVKRIADVRLLRARQFPEDAGPLAHPVRPETFGAIDNLYTATVYEKGAEVVRMLHVLLGEETFMRGMRLYVSRFDGQAATVEDFVRCMAEASGRDLSRFMRWYTQAGTPHVTVREHHDATAGTLTLDIAQRIPDTPGQSDKQPQHIPLRLALFDRDSGRRLPLVAATDAEPVRGDLLELTAMRQRFVFRDLPAPPVVSLNRGFSAPIRLQTDQSEDDLLFLLRHEDDAFSRWDAAQRLGRRLILSAMHGQGADVAPYADALGAVAAPLAESDPAFLAELLRLPDVDALAAHLEHDVDPEAIWRARRQVMAEIGRRLKDGLETLFLHLEVAAPYAPDPSQCGRRAARAAILSLLMQADEETGAMLARACWRRADNMTERAMAIDALARSFSPVREELLEAFVERYGSEPLLVDKWLAWHAVWPGERAADTVRRLMEDSRFSLTNPNRVRALLGTFAMANPVRFNAPDGSGYRLVADAIGRLDAINPQTAARLATAFRGWRALEPGRRQMARAALEALAGRPDLSRDVSDIVKRTLEG